MNKLTVICDVDEVLAKFLEHLLYRYNMLYNGNIKESDIKQWDLIPYIGQKGIELFKEKGFFTWLKPNIPMINMVEKLHNDGHEVLIVTAPASSYSASEKIQWLNHYLHFIPDENIIMTHKKWLIKGDIIIDDAPKFINTFDGIRICVSKPWNENVNAHLRTNNPDEIYEFISIL